MTDTVPPILFEMLRSFVTLARTLNLSHAVEELGTTRQTLRRHITQLEDTNGAPYFSLEGRRYALTQAGQQALPGALDLLSRAEAWLNGGLKYNNGMPTIQIKLAENRSFLLQQRPLRELWQNEKPLLREAYRAWALSGGDLQSESMHHIRSFSMVFRHSAAGWICVAIGENSAYAIWSGQSATLSSIGKSIAAFSGSEGFAHLVEEPFSQVSQTDAARLDHIQSHLPRETDGAFLPLRYRRLLLPGYFPDGSQALISVADIDNDIAFDGLASGEIAPASDDVSIPMRKEHLKFEQM